MNKLLRNDLIILDELGYIQLDATGSDHLFQLVARAYERRSLIVTSNLDFQDWGQLFDKPATAAAFLDRLLHHAHVISLKGDSYRIRPSPCTTGDGIDHLSLHEWKVTCVTTEMHT